MAWETTAEAMNEQMGVRPRTTQRRLVSATRGSPSKTAIRGSPSKARSSGAKLSRPSQRLKAGYQSRSRKETRTNGFDIDDDDDERDEDPTQKSSSTRAKPAPKKRGRPPKESEPDTSAPTGRRAKRQKPNESRPRNARNKTTIQPIQRHSDDRDVSDDNDEEQDAQDQESGADDAFGAAIKEDYHIRCLMYFGTHSAWRSVLEACASNKAAVPSRATSLTAEISRVIKDLRTLYRELPTARAHDSDLQRKNDTINEKLESLSEVVFELQPPRNLGPKFVGEVCTRTIPLLLHLLEDAMHQRASSGQELAFSSASLKEFHTLLGLMLMLCRKIDEWDITPPSNQKSAKTNVVRKVEPNIARLRIACSKYLAQVEVEVDRLRIEKQNERQCKNMRPATPEQERSARADRARQTWLMQTIQALREQAQRHDTMTSALKMAIPDYWSQQQDDKLVELLLNEKLLRKMPAKQMFIALGTVPGLQEKTPGQIQERALLHKPALANVMQEELGRIPLFISRIL